MSTGFDPHGATSATHSSRKRRSSEARDDGIGVINAADSTGMHPQDTSSFASSVPLKSNNASSNIHKTNAVRVQVRLKRFHAVAAWSWNANDHVCGICQSPFEGVCPGVKYPGEDCPVVWGKCGHAFHLQCVSKWLGQAASKNSCPICRQEWEFGQNPINASSSSLAISDNNNIDSNGSDIIAS